jgi:hypothetical protein
MELPFAVESPERAMGSSLQHSTGSSLVTASSQGSLMNSNLAGSPLPPNTPQDVVIPRYDNYHGQGHFQRGQEPEIMGEADIIDFTYVNVCETDADEVDILIEGGDPSSQHTATVGDVLTILLSGMQQNENEALVVSYLE